MLIELVYFVGSTWIGLDWTDSRMLLTTHLHWLLHKCRFIGQRLVKPMGVAED